MSYAVVVEWQNRRMRLRDARPEERWRLILASVLLVVVLYGLVANVTA